MMSAIVIKNIILFVLIVLIGHFLVKNFLIDKDGVNDRATTSIVTAQHPKDTDSIVQQTQLSKDATEPSLSKPEKEPEGLDKAKAELLKFIDEEENGGLTKYFAEPRQETSKVPTDDCKSKVQTSQFPLSTTCDPDIQIIDAAMKKEIPRKPKQCTNLTKNVLVLSEYDNENTMNGGELFNGLNAFDSFDNHFQLLN
jgi:hypothetical protein